MQLNDDGVINADGVAVESYIGGTIVATQSFTVKGGGYRESEPEFTWSDFEQLADQLAHCGAAGCQETGGYTIKAIDQGGTLAASEDNACHVSYCMASYGDNMVKILPCIDCSRPWRAQPASVR